MKEQERGKTMESERSGKILQLKQWIGESSHIVFFGGAGVSTESNIPDFRGADGLYSQKYKQKYMPEQIISHSFYVSHRKEFFTFYKEKMIFPEAKPNAAHLALAKLEQMGKCDAVITQNIDGLHQLAGSKKVLELHGSTLRNYCTRCGKFYSRQEILHQNGVPYCTCGGVIKPDVVLYEESLDQSLLWEAVRCIEHADMLIVGGTSLTVYPAAGLIDYYKGDKLVLINKSETDRDNRADLCLHESVSVLADCIPEE
jgi:NAD-dependent deacetylase